MKSLSNAELVQDMSNSNQSSSANIKNEIVTHYNEKKDTDLKSRNESRIVYLRNFNNWIKSVIIQETISLLKQQQTNRINVLDLGCGRGGDIQKWIRSRVNYVLFSDIADKSLEECERRYVQMNEQRRNTLFSCDFVHLDASRELLESKIDLKERHVNLVSCQFVLHYSFESFKQANTFVRNVSDALEVGGYFIGTTTDSYEIVKRLNESDTNSFGNSIYNVTYHGDKSKKIPLFGAKLDFGLEGVVDCPEYLLHFPTLVRIAEKYKLKLVAKQTFSELFSDYSRVPAYRALVSHMKSLEPFYLNKLKGDFNVDYSHVKNSNQNIQLFTLSQSEWDAATLYIAYSFVKIA